MDQSMLLLLPPTKSLIRWGHYFWCSKYFKKSRQNGLCNQWFQHPKIGQWSGSCYDTTTDIIFLLKNCSSNKIYLFVVLLCLTKCNSGNRVDLFKLFVCFIHLVPYWGGFFGWNGRATKLGYLAGHQNWLAWQG